MTRTLFAILLMLLVTTYVMAQKKEPTKIMLVPAADSLKAVSFTMDVLSVIDNKCIGCHNPKGRNEKARKKMQWELVQNLSGAEALSTFDKILEILEKGEMPPEKMVAKYPNMKLTEEESATLKAWAEATLEKLEK